MRLITCFLGPTLSEAGVRWDYIPPIPSGSQTQCSLDDPCVPTNGLPVTVNQSMISTCRRRDDPHAQTGTALLSAPSISQCTISI